MVPCINISIGSMKGGFRTGYHTWEETVKEPPCCPQPWRPRTHSHSCPGVSSAGAFQLSAAIFGRLLEANPKKIEGIWKAATSGVSVPAPMSAEVLSTFPAGFNVRTNVHLQHWGGRLDNSWEVYLLFRLQASLNAFVSHSEMTTELLVCDLDFMFL